MIQRVANGITAQQISSAFSEQDVAMISSITMIPYLFNNEIKYTTYIKIRTWMDSERAYEFISELQSNDAHIAILGNKYKVEINTHNDGNLFMYTYTTEFVCEPVEDENEYDNENLIPVALTFDNENDSDNMAILG